LPFGNGFEITVRGGKVVPSDSQRLTRPTVQASLKIAVCIDMPVVETSVERGFYPKPLDPWSFLAG
jgi:hypothetical protein